jgi:hypothetical protein
MEQDSPEKPAMDSDAVMMDWGSVMDRNFQDYWDLSQAALLANAHLVCW